MSLTLWRTADGVERDLRHIHKELQPTYPNGIRKIIADKILWVCKHTEAGNLHADRTSTWVRPKRVGDSDLVMHLNGREPEDGRLSASDSKAGPVDSNSGCARTLGDRGTTSGTCR